MRKPSPGSFVVGAGLKDAGWCRVQRQKQACVGSRLLRTDVLFHPSRLQHNMPLAKQANYASSQGFCCWHATLPQTTCHMAENKAVLESHGP